MEELLTYTDLFRYITNYSLSFVVSLLGVFTNEIMRAVKNEKKIKYVQVMSVSIFCGLLLNVLQDRFKFNFSLYMFICFMVGIWGSRILILLASNNFFKFFFKNILKSTLGATGSIGEAASKTMDDIDKEMEDEEKKSKEKKEEEG